ncbi:MAG: aldolase/citrate lyase family protein [Actinomycetota bacterium]|nr:aldolase/citrate lyase family protein [Actinomycetota bacterium]
MEQFLRESWRDGKAALGIWCSVSDTLIAEVLASVKPDYVCVDMQHGQTHAGNLVSMMQAVKAGGSVPIARVAESNPALIMKALDAGARGVIVPLVESREQARRAVEACRFPPRGTRSFGPYRASITAESSDPYELEQVACIVMIETQRGIANLEEIVTTEGVTAAYVGPSDLSLALGLPPGSVDAPEFVSVLEDIRAACEAHGVIPGLHCYEGRTALRAVEQGFKMVTVAVELRLLRAALALELDLVRSAYAPAAITEA